MKLEARPLPRPPRKERDAVRRAQIVEATRLCALRQGFQAMPMAEVARVARMSVGQIYRYFRSKDAIVLAIVDDIVERRITRMTDDPRSPATPERLASRRVELDDRHREDALLMIEISAEATRNPEIAEKVRQADQRSQIEARHKMMRRFPEITEEQAAARCEFVAVLIEGTVVRRGTQLQADPKEMRALYEKIIAVIHET